MKTFTLRPGLLVSLKTSIRGNVSYRKEEIEADHYVDDTARRAKWETTRTVLNAQEHAAATVVKGKARYTVARLCYDTGLGLLCPASQRDDLDAAIAEAREKIEAFNSESAITRIQLSVIVGVVAQDDVEATRAIRAEVSDLLSTMDAGVRNLEPEKIREAASRARALGAMLSDGGKAKVQEAIDGARKAATAMIKAAKAGETAAEEVSKLALEKLENARTAFLDLDEAAGVAEPIAAGRAVDFEPGSADFAAPVPMFASSIEV